ncbi:MAG: DUF362 domain-containing protein, partial [Desulfopila sp.]
FYVVLFKGEFFMVEQVDEGMAVFLQRCADYDRDALKSFFQLCLDEQEFFSPRSSRVLIKPNLISARGPGLACTHPEFLLSLAEFLVDSGADVVLGDSPAFGRASSVLRRSGVDKKLTAVGVDVVDFTRSVEQRLQCGVDVRVAAEVLECDYCINAPKVKAHNQMYATMAMKNIFGIVVGMQKGMLHMRHGSSEAVFAAIIADLLSVLPPHCTVVDGVVAMHRRGPLHGDSIDLGCIGCASDTVALETALLRALELDASRSPLWCEARRRNWPGTVYDTLSFPLLAPEDFAGTMFEAPSQLDPIRFNPFRFLRGSLQRLLAWQNR